MARYARAEIALIVLVGALVTTGAAHVGGWWALAPAAAALALLAFYRDPPRRPPAGADLLLAPADGKIVELARGAPREDGQRVLRITIFLSVLDVHINRSPCAGRVVDRVYRRGAFRSALRAEASAENESNLLVLEPAPPLPGPVHVRQIAGVLARRIVCTARPGDTLAAGERIGMIKLGSRTEVSLPDDGGWDLAVGRGDRVRAGRTVLARRRTADTACSSMRNSA